MNPRVINVFPTDDYQLLLTFSNNEQKVFDMKPWLDKGIFIALSNKELFRKAYVAWGTVAWNDELDMSPDTLYIESRINTGTFNKAQG